MMSRGKGKKQLQSLAVSLKREICVWLLINILEEIEE